MWKTKRRIVEDEKREVEKNNKGKGETKIKDEQIWEREKRNK